MSKNCLAFLLLCFTFVMHAQQVEPQMADKFREDGKIYVVITVIAIIFVALAGFLFYIDRKLRKIEDKVNHK